VKVGGTKRRGERRVKGKDHCRLGRGSRRVRHLGLGRRRPVVTTTMTRGSSRKRRTKLRWNVQHVNSHFIHKPIAQKTAVQCSGLEHTMLLRTHTCPHNVATSHACLCACLYAVCTWYLRVAGSQVCKLSCKTTFNKIPSKKYYCSFFFIRQLLL
jgi:hypothetical protein